MDAVCIKGDWDVILDKNKAGKLLGVLVYHHRRVYGFNMIINPLMTAYNGIHLLYPDNLSNYEKGQFTYKHTQTLIDRLPKYSLYYQQYHTDYQNWLGLHWNGYKQTGKYTYIIDSSIGKEKLWSQLKRVVQKDITKAEEICDIIEIDMNTFLSEAKQAFADQNREQPANEEALMRLYSKLHDKGSLRIIAAQHKETGENLSAQIIVHDKNTSYALACYTRREKEMRTTLSLLLWHVISSNDRRYFDFDGSIIQGVERYMRSFGGELIPHHKIYKVTNPILRLGLHVFKPQFFG